MKRSIIKETCFAVGNVPSFTLGATTLSGAHSATPVAGGNNLIIGWDKKNLINVDHVEKVIV
jgi:hypothetical protein